MILPPIKTQRYKFRTHRTPVTANDGPDESAASEADERGKFSLILPAGVSKSLTRSVARGVILSPDEMATVIGSRPQKRATLIADSVRIRFSQGLLLLLAICFVLQVFSPLRLNTDAIVLLSMGESAAQGGGFLDSGQKAVFPPGYPALLAILLRLGLAHPWVIVGLNVVFLSVGLFAAYSLLIREFFDDRAVVLTICSFFLLSYVVVKHFTIPLTDVPFFCCSMCCLAVMSRITKMDWNWRFVILAGAAWLLAFAAITVRTIGVALLPPLVFMLVSSSQFKLLVERLSLRTKLIVLTVGTFVVAGTTYVLANTSYWRILVGVAKRPNISGLILQIFSYRLRELGELFGNFPITKMPIKLHVVVPWLGLLLLLLILCGLATKRREINTTGVFIVCYLGILLVWPYYDARFWLPVIPLLIAYSLLGVKSLRIPKAAITIYCIIFATLGFGVIAYSTRITFAGDKFPDRYGDGSLRPTYCAAFQSCRDGGDPNKVNAKVLRLLREYK